MRIIKKVLASDVGLIVGRICGFEKHGLTHRMRYDAKATSAGQCSKCHAVVWANGRLLPMFNRPIPPNVPESGPRYTQYYFGLRDEFLQALSPCPQCGDENSFDLDLNQGPQRFPDGSVIEIPTDAEFVETTNPEEAWIWWAEFPQS
jgi:hypothetical protein